jgi:hypothetical protein
VRGPSTNRLVDRFDGPVRQGLLVAGQEAKIRDEGSPEESKSEVRPDLHLQKYRIRVSTLQSILFRYFGEILLRQFSREGLRIVTQTFFCFLNAVFEAFGRKKLSQSKRP